MKTYLIFIIMVLIGFTVSERPNAHADVISSTTDNYCCDPATKSMCLKECSRYTNSSSLELDFYEGTGSVMCYANFSAFLSPGTFSDGSPAAQWSIVNYDGWPVYTYYNGEEMVLKGNWTSWSRYPLGLRSGKLSDLILCQSSTDRDTFHVELCGCNSSLSLTYSYVPMESLLTSTTTTIYDTSSSTTIPETTTTTSVNTTTTTTAPVEKLTVTGHTPSKNQINVDYEHPGISISFNKLLDPSTVSSDTIRVSYATAPSYSISYTCSATGSTASCDASMTNFGWKVRVTVKGGKYGVRGANGEEMSNDYSFTFSTIPDVTVKVVPVQVVEDVPFVQNKPAVVRVVATWNISSDIEQLPAKVKVTYDDGASFEKEAIFYCDDAKAIPKDFVRRGKSVNFYSRLSEVPIIATTGSHKIHATVTPSGQTGSNPKKYESSASIETVRRTSPFRTLWCVANVGSFKTSGAVDISELSTANDALLKKLYPVASTRLGFKDNKVNIEPGIFSIETPILNSVFYPKQCLRNLAMINWFGTYNCVVGVAPDNWMTATYASGGVHANYIPGITTYAVLVSENAHSAVAPHEIGHVFGCNDISNSSISPGYDIWRDRYLDSTVDNTPVKTLKYGWVSLMDEDILGYVDGIYADIWMDKSSYQTIFNHLTVVEENILSRVTQSSATEQNQLLLMTGSISIEGSKETAAVESVHIVTNKWGATPESNGDYTLRLVDATGSMIDSIAFSPDFDVKTNGDKYGVFMAAIPYDDRAQKALILHRSAELASIEKSAHPPTIVITKPIASSIAQGDFQAMWQVQDADSDPVFCTLLLSVDNGETWEFIDMDVTDTTYTINTTRFPNSSTCLLKVTANDGFNTTEVTSSAFAILNSPAVVGTAPAHGATGVAVDTAEISIVFRDDMNASTLNASSIMLQDKYGNLVSGTITYDEANRQVVFLPAEHFKYGMEYTGIVTTGVKDALGMALAKEYTWTFTTEPDAYAPSVISLVPAHLEGNVAVNQVIQAGFDEPMDATGFTSHTFTLIDQSGSSVEGSVSYDAASQSAVFTPRSYLQPDTTYTATLKASVKDLSGNALASDISWSFTTGTEAAAPSTTTTIYSDDICERHGWYGDGECDHICQKPDPDCEGEMLCPVESVLGKNSPQLEALRHFRDERLTKSAEGKRLLQLYYRHAAQISEIIQKHGDVRAALQHLLVQGVPVAANIVRTGHASVKKSVLQEARSFIGALKNRADNGLGNDLINLEKKIDDAAWLNSLGIRFQD
ncbi:MAG: Ig-like domain-containing protein [Desulfobacterota bacterium]|nr:Ig-like domain-containing protein [Thermodesulfobacteriota bacterium]